LLDTLGAGDDGRKLESGGLRDVEGEGDLATRRTQHADAARLRPRGEAGTEGGHLDPLVEGADAHHARRSEGRLAHLVASPHRAPRLATAPVWPITAARPRCERPLFTTMTGLPRVAARRAAATKRCGWLNCSKKPIITPTSSSSTR